MLLVVSSAAPILTRTRWSRDRVFHLTGVLTATVGMTVWIVGVSTSLSLAITYFGLVVALGTLLGCRWFARLERGRAGIALGSPHPEHYVRSSPPSASSPGGESAGPVASMAISANDPTRSPGARHRRGRIRGSCRLVGGIRQLFDTVAERAARQHGRITWRQLRAAGVDTDRIGRWSADGRLRRVHHGVYAVGHTAPSPHAELMAAVLACGEGARASHHSGGHLFGILRFRPIKPHVTVPTTAGRTRPGILVHRVRELHRGDVTSYYGIPMTTPARVLLDLAPHLTPPELARACHEAWVRCQITPRHVESCIARNPTKKGVAKLRRAQLADVTLSVLEDGFLQLLRGHDLPIPRTNIDVAGDKLDCHWPQRELTVELLSYRFHGSRHAFEADIARRRRSNHVAFSYGDVFERGAQTAAEVAEMLADGA